MKSLLISLVLSVTAGCLLPALAQAEEPSVTMPDVITTVLKDNLCITVTPVITSQDERYFIEIKGTTNLPDKTILRATLNYEVANKPTMIDMKYGWVEKNAYNISFGPYDVKPPCGIYSGQVEFDPVKQVQAVKIELVNVPAFKTLFNLPCGTPQEIEQVHDNTLSAVLEQAKQLPVLFNELNQTFKQYSTAMQVLSDSAKAFNQTAWQKWLREFEQQLDMVSRTTAQIDPFRSFDMVTKRKGQIEGISYQLRRLAQSCNEALTKPEQFSGAVYEKILNDFTRFESVLKEQLDFLDTGTTVNQEVIGQGFKLLKEQLDNIKTKMELINNGSLEALSELEAWLADWQPQVSALIFDMAKELPLSAYAQLSELSGGMMDLLTRCQAAAKNASPEVAVQFNQIWTKTNQLLEELTGQYLKSDKPR